MFCSKCGKEISAGVAFCQHCGNPVNTSKEDATDSVKNMAGSLFRSFQEKAKSVGESFNTISEEAQKEEKKPQPEKTNRYTGRNEGRFIEDTFANGIFSYCGAVIVDRLTGVNYLFAHKKDYGGLTVLVDENGKPLVTKEYKMETDTEDN